MYLAFQAANMPSLWLPSITKQPFLYAAKKSSLVACSALTQSVSQSEREGLWLALLNAGGRLLVLQVSDQHMVWLQAGQVGYIFSTGSRTSSGQVE